jgi:speckle-type POZ protein
VGGHCWRIHYYPNGLCSSSADFISAFLKIEDTAGLNKSPVTAQFMFSVVDESGDAPPPLQPCKAVVKKFTGPWSNIWGQPEFIERDVLEESGHLRDDCFTIRCDATSP